LINWVKLGMKMYPLANCKPEANFIESQLAEPCGLKQTFEVLRECAPAYVRDEIKAIREKPDAQRIVNLIHNVSMLRPEHINPGMDCLAKKIPSIKVETDGVKLNPKDRLNRAALAIKLFKMSQCTPPTAFVKNTNIELASISADPCLGLKKTAEIVMNSIPAHILDAIINLMNEPKPQDLIDLVDNIKTIAQNHIDETMDKLAGYIPSLKDVTVPCKTESKKLINWVKLGMRMVPIANCKPESRFIPVEAFIQQIQFIGA